MATANWGESETRGQLHIKIKHKQNQRKCQMEMKRYKYHVNIVYSQISKKDLPDQYVQSVHIYSRKLQKYHWWNSRNINDQISYKRSIVCSGIRKKKKKILQVKFRKMIQHAKQLLEKSQEKFKVEEDLKIIIRIKILTRKHIMPRISTF